MDSLRKALDEVLRRCYSCGTPIPTGFTHCDECFSKIPKGGDQDDQ